MRTSKNCKSIKLPPASGIAYPDYIVLGPELLVQGSPGVRAAGFFGTDWSVDTGEFAWR
jgi:hypothetical protein